MSETMDLDAEGGRLLAILARTLDLSDLSFDDEDTCVFVLDGKMVVQLQLDRVAEELVIGVIFGRLPENAPASILRRLLGANLFWQLTQGGTIGLDEASGALTLCYDVQLPLKDPETIVTIARKLVGAAAHWARQLDGIIDSPPALPEMGGGMMRV